MTTDMFTHEYWDIIAELYREKPQSCEDAISRQAALKLFFQTIRNIQGQRYVT